MYKTFSTFSTLSTCFRPQESRIYVSIGIQCVLPVFVIVLVGCEFLSCVFRALYFLEFGSVHTLWLKFHRPSTVMMKWRPVILTPLIGVTLVTHVNSCLESDMTFGLRESWHGMVIIVWERLRIYLAHPVSVYFTLIFLTMSLFYWLNMCQN